MSVQADQIALTLRIVIEHPVAGVLHSLQDKDGAPLDPKRSEAGEPLTFTLPIRVAPGPKFFGDQIRREGPVRRFVYIRVGQSAGDHASPWERRMKVDVHDIDPTLIGRAIASTGAIALVVNGTGKDGTPACATVPTVPVAARLVPYPIESND